MQSSDVRIDAAGCLLAATYAEVASPVAAALLIVGSGRIDRNSGVRLPGGQKLRGAITRAAAAALDAAGVSTLRFDKRGVGASAGDYLSTRPDPASIGPRGYRRQARQPVSPEVLHLITDWVTRHWGVP